MGENSLKMGRKHEDSEYVCVACEPMLPRDLPGQITLENGLIADSAPPFQLCERWMRDLGQLMVEQIQARNLFLSINIVGTGQDSADQTGLCIRAALVLAGVRFRGDLFQLHVAGAEHGPSIRGLRRMQPPGCLSGWPSETINTATLVKVDELVCGLRAFMRHGHKMRRFRNGLWALLRGLDLSEAGDAGERLHQCVRAVEALVFARKDNGCKDFRHKAKCFVESGDENEAILKELYVLRGKFEHLAVLADVILEPPVTSKEAEAQIMTAAYRAERLASCVYSWILRDIGLLDVFADGQINVFREGQDHERLRIWGGCRRIDLARIKYRERPSNGILHA